MNQTADTAKSNAAIAAQKRLYSTADTKMKRAPSGDHIVFGKTDPYITAEKAKDNNHVVALKWFK